MLRLSLLFDERTEGTSSIHSFSQWWISKYSFQGCQQVMDIVSFDNCYLVVLFSCQPPFDLHLYAGLGETRCFCTTAWASKFCGVASVVQHHWKKLLWILLDPKAKEEYYSEFPYCQKALGPGIYKHFLQYQGKMRLVPLLHFLNFLIIISKWRLSHLSSVGKNSKLLLHQAIL